MSNSLAPHADDLVSVAFPSFNHERYIEATLRSIYDQTYERLELIVVDDGSSDATFEIASDIASSPKYQQRFDCVTITKNEVNLGAHASLNRCLSMARGKFTSFLNSDDLYAPARIEKMTQECVGKNSGFAFSGTLAVDEKGHPEMFTDVGVAVNLNPIRAMLNLPSLSFGFLRYQLTSSTGNMFVLTELAKSIGGFDNLRYCHDWDFAMRVICRTEPVFVPDDLYLYRIHPTNSYKSLGHLAMQESEQVLTRYFRNILVGNVSNRLAPTPANWPQVFEVYAELFEVIALWKSVSGVRLPHWRTMEGAS